MTSPDPTATGRERLKNIAERLREEYGAQRVILFGSAARGEATEDSDIDLLVISPTAERFYTRMASVLKTVRDISQGIPLSPIVLTPDELKARLDRGDQFIQDIGATGVDL
jgi:predicted nucleotidyltransferase